MDQSVTKYFANPVIIGQLWCSSFTVIDYCKDSFKAGVSIISLWGKFGSFRGGGDEIIWKILSSTALKLVIVLNMFLDVSSRWSCCTGHSSTSRMNFSHEESLYTRSTLSINRQKRKDKVRHYLTYSCFH